MLGHRASVVCCVSSLVVVACAGSARAIDLNTWDTFQDGTVMDWLGGTSITNKLDGRAGPLDRYIQVDSNSAGGGAGSKPATHNAAARWIGDYQAAGITGIQVDLINQSSTPLEMRLVLFGSGNRFTSTTTVSLPANNNWGTYFFPINQSSLVRVLGNITYQQMIVNVNQIMFRHDPGTPSSGGAAADATFGMDNVRAIPAPGAGLALLGGVGMLGMRRRR